MLDLTPDELLTTTRSVRRRLDLSRPVERSVVLDCIEVAVQAPSGSNSQGWQWVIVTDPDLRRQIAAYYGANFDTYARGSGARFPANERRADRRDEILESAVYLREHLHEVPVLVIPCAMGRLPDNAPTPMQAGFWGSVLPAVWSFMLALRARGLGSTLTSLHLPNERDVADLLGIPHDRVTQTGLLPVAYTKGTDFRPAARVPASDVVHWDRW